MGKLITEKETLEVADGDSIVEACEKVSVPFSCYVGSCGSCKIKIIKGKENLTELTQEEKDLDMDEDNRLACQCKIKSGDVEIRFD
jgi:ferredoxin